MKERERERERGWGFPLKHNATSRFGEGVILFRAHLFLFAQVAAEEEEEEAGCSVQYSSHHVEEEQRGVDQVRGSAATAELLQGWADHRADDLLSPHGSFHPALSGVREDGECRGPG